MVLVPQPSDHARWRRSHPPEVVSAAIRLAQCRRRARSKFTRAELMWLDPIGLEQSTSEPVARHKAQRFVDASVVDLCCGIGGDAMAFAAVARSVVAVDSDHGMCRRTLWNARAYDLAERLQAVRSRAERFAYSDSTLVHIDPDRRRRGSKRAQWVEDFAPSADELLALTRSSRGGAIKLGPASDFDAYFDDPTFEIELVSLNGECKEAAVWFGDRVSCRRRATVLPADQTWTDRDGARGGDVRVSGSNDWVFDPDPALSRSGLVAGFALAHGLGRLAVGVEYLTRPHRIESPFLSAFEGARRAPLRRQAAAPIRLRPSTGTVGDQGARNRRPSRDDPRPAPPTGDQWGDVVDLPGARRSARRICGSPRLSGMA